MYPSFPTRLILYYYSYIIFTVRDLYKVIFDLRFKCILFSPQDHCYTYRYLSYLFDQTSIRFFLGSRVESKFIVNLISDRELYFTTITEGHRTTYSLLFKLANILLDSKVYS